MTPNPTKKITANSQIKDIEMTEEGDTQDIISPIHLPSNTNYQHNNHNSISLLTTLEKKDNEDFNKPPQQLQPEPHNIHQSTTTIKPPTNILAGDGPTRTSGTSQIDLGRVSLLNPHSESPLPSPINHGRDKSGAQIIWSEYMDDSPYKLNQSTKSNSSNSTLDECRNNCHESDSTLLSSQNEGTAGTRPSFYECIWGGIDSPDTSRASPKSTLKLGKG
ncbi:hypothetical protein FXO38_28040 [Capsicum annuum]|nr:hypothetical protein FXO38_28040 [Capsicum annuum]